MKRNILLTILSGVMLVAAFPPIDIGFLAWVGMVPFFFALDGWNTRRNFYYSSLNSPCTPSLIKRGMGGVGFLLGLLWGIVFFLGTVYWVVNSMVNYGGIPFVAGILVLMLLAVYLSFFFALFGFAVAALSYRNISSLFMILLAPSLWVTLEYLRANMITLGFPWVLLGYSQSSFLPLIQIADITGVYGVSFLIVMVNLFLFLVINRHRAKGKGQSLKNKDKNLSPFTFHLSSFLREGLLISIVLISVLAYGFFRIYETDKASAHWKDLKIGVAQGNIDQGIKWDPSFQKEIVDIYRNLSLGMASQGVELIIWPESALPFFLQSDKEFGHQIFDVTKQTNAYLLTGADSYGPGNGKEVRYYNSAFLIGPDGELVGKYDKIHLVPFGEYVPLKTYLPFIRKLVVGVGDFTPGKRLKPLEFNGNSFGTLICFESIFPELASGFVKEGAGFLINITNDAWFGRTSAPYQHFSQAVFRAVENKVFLIRGANTGISGVIDPVGRIKLKSGIFTTESMVEDIKIRNHESLTLYARYGDIFAIGCVLVSIIGLGSRVLGLRKISNVKIPMSNQAQNPKSRLDFFDI